MGEYITKEAAINAVENAPIELFQSEWEEIEEAINAAPAADVVPTQRWIPLTEQLPPMGVDVLLCHEYGCVIGFRDGYKWGIKGMTVPESIYAWMLIPEVPREMFI